MPYKRCPFCMEEIQDSALKCKECSSVLYAVQASSQPERMQPCARQTYWLPIPSLVLGILCTLIFMDGSSSDAATLLGGLLFGALALGLGVVSVARQQLGRGMAITGIVLGSIVLLAFIGRWSEVTLGGRYEMPVL
jgi:hypothetical protein